MNPETKHLWNEAINKSLDLAQVSARLVTKIGHDVIDRISQEPKIENQFDQAHRLHNEMDAGRQIELPEFPDEVGELKSLKFHFRGESGWINRENTKVVIIRDKPELAHLIINSESLEKHKEDIYVFGDLLPYLDRLNNIGLPFDLRSSLDDKAKREYTDWSIRQLLEKNSPQ